MNFIEFDSVSKEFQENFWSKKIKALDRVSFTIPKGETVGFLGANGAGKTTAIKLLLDFIKKSSGNIIYNQALGKNHQEIFKNIGHFPEHPYFYPHLTGGEFVTYMGKISGVFGSKLSTNISYWSKRLNIDYALDRKIRGYSKGMLQRLGFLSSIVHDPKLLILDEPLSGLDPIGRKEFKDVIKEILANGRTIFFSSHILSDVEEVCSKVIVLNQGRCVHEGRISQLLEANQTMESSIYYKYNDELKHIFCSNNDVNNKVKEMIDSEYKIIKVEQVMPTLEEIIYGIGKNGQ